VASLAPLVGVFGTLLGIAHAFRGTAGSRISIMAGIAKELSEALVPTALGLIVALVSVCCYQYLIGRLGCFDGEMENASFDLVKFLAVCPVRPSPVVGVGFVNETPLFRDDIGEDLLEHRRPWYRSTSAAVGMLILSWCVQIARYFDQQALPLGSATWPAFVYVVFTFAVSWFVAYPVWVKALRRTPGALAASASLICMCWSLAELMTGEHLW
jgi:hypothetical protein